MTHPIRIPGRLHSLALLVCLPILLVACSPGGSINYTIFGRSSDSNSYNFYATAGDTLTIDYSISPNNGSVSISAYDAFIGGDSIYYESIDSEQSDVIRIPIEKTGFHDLFVSLTGFDGSYSITWRLDKPVSE